MLTRPLVLADGRIVTQDRDRPVVEALLIERGLVRAAGRTRDVRRIAGPDPLVLGLDGRSVIPGLLDSHLEPDRAARALALGLGWDDIESLEEGLARVRHRAAHAAPGDWIRVLGGWSAHALRERRPPTTAELTESAADVPAVVLHLHRTALFNAAAVRALDPQRIELEAGAREGTRLERFPDGGVALHAEPDAGPIDRLLALLPELPEAEHERALRNLRRELARHAVVFAGYSGAIGRAFPDDGFDERGPDDADRRGAELYDRTRFLLRSGWPVRVRATHDASVRIALDALERADADERAAGRRGLAGVRWGIDHAETIASGSIARVAALGGGIALQGRLAWGGEAFADHYGRDVASDAPPLDDILNAGVPVGLGLDGEGIGSLDPWPVIAWLTSGHTVAGTRLLAERHRCTREQALWMHTVGSAWFAGQELERGRFVVGQPGDFAVLDRDFHDCSDDELGGTRSVLTCVAGEPLHASGPYAGLAST